MEIYQEQVQSPTHSNVQITILKLVGDLDGSNFKQVIEQAEQVCNAGATHLLIDLSEMRFMSSAGLATLHRVAVLMRKRELDDTSESWTSLAELKDRAGSPGEPEKRVKLLNPQPRVRSTLEMVGYDKIFEIFTDRQTALAAFQ